MHNVGSGTLARVCKIQLKSVIIAKIDKKFLLCLSDVLNPVDKRLNLIIVNDAPLLCVLELHPDWFSSIIKDETQAAKITFSQSSMRHRSDRRKLAPPWDRRQIDRRLKREGSHINVINSIPKHRFQAKRSSLSPGKLEAIDESSRSILNF